MVFWGACWGAFFAWLLGLDNWYGWGLWHVLLGAGLGALLGASLRRVLQREWENWLQSKNSSVLLQQATFAQTKTAESAAPTAPAADSIGASALVSASGADASYGSSPISAAAQTASDTVDALASTPAPAAHPLAAAKPSSAKRRLLDSAYADKAASHTQAQTPAEVAALAEVHKLQAAPAEIAHLAAPVPEAWADPRVHASSASGPGSSSAETPAWLQAAQNWLTGGNVVVRLGVFLLFIGLGFLAKYAVQAGLFPPPLRVASIAAVGFGLLLAGWRLRSGSVLRRQQYALTLQGAGVAVLYLSVYAALRLYGLLTPTLAFVLLAVIAGLGAILALVQSSQVLAFIGFAGGYAAPLLASSGGNQFVLLFSYYLLLNVVLVGLAYARAWRALNLLGFGFSFAVLGTWVASQYQPSQYAQVQPFVLAYFALYVLAALFYAMRHSLAPRQALDATLLFGVPAVSLGIQNQLVQGTSYGAAWSSAAMAGFYALLSIWTQAQAARSADADRSTIARWLSESYLALALVCATLAVPLALDAQWTAAIWALEGAAVYWVGQRQGHWFPRLMGLALQPVALYVFWEADISSTSSAVLHPRLLGLLVLAAAAALLCYWLHGRERYAAARQASADSLTGWSKAAAAWVDGLERVALVPLFALGLWSWVEAGYKQITRYISGSGLETAFGPDYGHAWIPYPYQNAALLVFFALTAWALHFAARPERRKPLAIAAAPTALLLPVLLVFAGIAVLSRDAFWEDAGWLAWPLALTAYAHALRGVDGSSQGQTQPWWSWVHILTWLVPALLMQDTLNSAVRASSAWNTAWEDSTWLLAACFSLAALYWGARRAAHWPWTAYAAPLQRWGLSLWALLVAVLGLQVALQSDGNSAPWAYLPLLNPADAALLVAGGLLWASARVLAAADADADARLFPPLLTRWALALWGFIALNTVWLRVVHHWWSLPWDSSALYGSFVTQAGYSILWTLLALGMMLLATRRGLRSLWLAGAGLLGLTVFKLLLVDLSNSGGAERIISFIAVGGLMLVLGYFVPLPAKTEDL